MLDELGLDLPEELFFELRTVGDVWHYFETKVLATAGSADHLH